MKKEQFFVVLALLLSLLSKSGSAQEINISGEYRINPVYSRGFREPLYAGDKPGFFTMQRTRLILDYTKAKDLETELIIQDRRFWGEESDRADIASLTVFRAWAEKYFTPELSLRLGRQGFVYDDQQILGDPNWVGTRAHDAAVLKYEKGSIKAHLAGAYSSNAQDLKWEPYQNQNYRDMEFLWVEKSFSKSSISFIFINRGLEKPDSAVAHTQTFGPYADIQLTDKLSFKGLYNFQMGTNAADKKVSAYLFSAQLFYSPNDRIIINPGMDVGSGTNQSLLNDPTNNKSHSFDRMYGLVHGKFGYMDYFYVNDPTLCGAQDYYIKVKATIGDAFTIDNQLHSFAASATINNALDGTPMSKQLGIENDLTLGYKFSPNFNASLAYCVMFGTPTLDQFFGGRKSQEMQVFYAVITATPSFFKSKSQ